MMELNNIKLEDIEISKIKGKQPNNLDRDYDLNEEHLRKKTRDEQINVEISKEDKRDVHINEIADDTDNDLQVVEKFQVPPHLKKTFIFSLVLAAIGITLFILGFIQDVAAADPGKGVTFWVLGSIVTIPGGYYSYQFYKAKKALDLDERDEILENIPEL